MQTALTDEGYWDSIWNFTERNAAAPALEVDPSTRWRDAQIAAHLGPGKRFLEIGAGGSPWPAHVANKYQSEAWGIDFSRQGLQLAARAVTCDRRLVHLVAGDFFDRSALPSGAFDVVYSAGFVEHFPEPLELMRRVAELLKPGGVVVTTVPNLCGINGLMQRVLDVETYRRHVVIAPADLDAAHALGGLVPLRRARYVGVIDLSAVNYASVAEKTSPLILRTIQFAMSKLRAAGSVFDMLTHRDGGRWLAPMVGGVYGATRSPDRGTRGLFPTPTPA
ncbi:MAG TPA: class I SAM-dependent methyltransferase [Gemmatimonadaceae bacterium]|nr:class I SAM-dependent methyltransferase [Gemmatimonadaceae bacterium]